MEVNDGHGIVDRSNSPTIPGDRHFLDPRSWVLLWQIYLQRNWLGFGHRHASGRRAHRTAWHHHLGTAEGHRLPLVSVCRRLRRRAADDGKQKQEEDGGLR